MSRRTAIILGGASTLAEDKAAALELFTPDYVICCNHAGRDEPGRVDALATMHPELVPGWLRERRRHGRPEPGSFWHARHRIPAVEGSRSIESWGGSSGLLCVAVAFELQCTHIVLAGVPMEKMLCHYDDKRPWMEARQYWPSWDRHLPKMLGRVKSMSGHTRDILGEPTRIWLDGDRT